MTKEAIIQQLQENYEQLIEWLEAQEPELFDRSPEAGKWSTGQHVRHLIQSTTPLNQALRMPRMALRSMFGTNNREERTYDLLVQRYHTKLAEGGRASGRYEPETIQNEQKAELISELRKELGKLTDIISQWPEKKMSQLLLPHPLLGKLTIREMLCFTVYHTEHHYKILESRYGNQSL